MIRCLLRPYTSGGHSLKNQIHCTWPNCPHSLTVQRCTHSSSEGAHPQAGKQACQILNHSPRPPWCAVSVVRAVTKTLCCWCVRYSDLHSWLIFTPFYPLAVQEHLKNIQEMFAVIMYFSEVHKSPKNRKSMPRAVPSPPYPVNISRRCLPMP